MRIPLYQVDAFTTRRFGGNPAAVCPLSEWPDDRLLLDIAAENNLSETAYLVARDDGYELRWFTPAGEVPLCGHATLASAYVVFRWLTPARNRVRFFTRQSGELQVEREGERLRMTLPRQDPQPGELPAALATALGGRPRAFLSTADKDLVIYEREAEVRALAPDFRALAAHGRDVIVSAPGEQCDFVSRFFAPAFDIDEDPVTGSAHCLLTPYWAARLGKTRLQALQVSERLGELECQLGETTVELWGGVMPYLVGEIEV